MCNYRSSKQTCPCYFSTEWSNKNITASWNLRLALNLVAVTNKAQGLEECKHVQEEIVHMQILYEVFSHQKLTVAVVHALEIISDKRDGI